jgi:DNA-binding transcriptional regulator/RsmH inhibitor MraZ
LPDVYSTEEWNTLKATLMVKAKESRVLRNFASDLTNRSYESNINYDWFLKIPDSLMHTAKLNDTVTIIDKNDHFEVYPYTKPFGTV